MAVSDTLLPMQTVLDRKLLVITGKGGVGKTTIAAALGLLAASGGRRTIVVEVGQESRLPQMFGNEAAQPGVETRLQERLSSISIDPDRALLEWLQALGGRVSGRVLASSGTFQYFAAAAPGARELVTMVKVWQLTRGGGRGTRSGSYDLVVLDAPATGHALGMLGSPQTFGAIARVGPIVGYTRQLQELLETPSRSAYLAVALATEMAVTEALELQDGLRRQLGRGLSAVVVNALLPRRFSTEELQRIESAGSEGTLRAGAGSGVLAGATTAGDLQRAAIGAALQAARAVHDRARFQQNQLARLRRRSFDVVGVPFVWGSQLDLPALQGIATRLERRL
jgi:anion-transporting  ArsA/GET3 family ATPase